MNRDPISPETLFLPSNLRDAAKRLEYSDFSEAQSIVSEIQTQLEVCKSDLRDVLTRHFTHYVALEAQLRTALKLETDQTMQYGERYALALRGLPLAGEALEMANELHAARTMLRITSTLYNQVQTRLTAAAEALKQPLKEVVLAAGFDEGDFALMHQHLILLNPPLPSSSEGSVKA